MRIIDRLEKYCGNAIPMHMPGHKRNTELTGRNGYLERLSANIDITEIDGFDNLNKPEGIILESERGAAELWKSAETHFLVNGSTSGILAALYACTRRSKRVLVARNCHKSVYNSIRVFELEPVYVLPETDADTGACGRVNPEMIEKILQSDENIKTVIITSPTYEGLISDISSISEIVHRHGAVLIVDEAHGAHLGLYDIFPKNALDSGADIVVQSLHKTLPSLTSTAVVHISELLGNEEICEEIKRSITMFTTSSPSYLLISSIDSCVMLMKEQGRELLHQWKKNLDVFYEKVAGLKNLKIRIYNELDEKKMTDPSKLIVTCHNGVELAEILRKRYNIEVEMAAAGYIIAMTGIGDTEESLDLFADALIDIDNGKEQLFLGAEENTQYAGNVVFPAVPEKDISLHKAYLQSGYAAEYTEAEGKTIVECIWAYPPGIPLILPGEKISNQVIRFISEAEKMGVELHSDRRNQLQSKLLVM